ncbi:hypothetical protein J6Q66_05270 [bacterium]|nr:hypothetical protein [bacterium]
MRKKLKQKKLYLITLKYNNKKENLIVYHKKDIGDKVNYFLQCCRLRKTYYGVIDVYNIVLNDQYKNHTEQDLFDGNVEIISRIEIEKVTISF